MIGLRFGKWVKYCFFASLLIFLATCSQFSSESIAPSEGKEAPDFALSDLSNRTIRLSDQRGHPVILNFWATWCGPCRSEMPDIQAISVAYQKSGLVVLGINNQETYTKVASFVKENGLTFPILLDSTGKTTEAYQIQGFPTSFFIDSKGVIRKINIGSMTSSNIEEIFRESLILEITQSNFNGNPTETISPGKEVGTNLTIEGCVTSSALNVRTGPGTSYSIGSGLHNGDCRLFEARSSDSTWIKLAGVTTKDGKGMWVSSQFIDLHGSIDSLPVGK